LIREATGLVRAQQRDHFRRIRVQSEIRVERPSRNAPVFIGGEHQQEAFRGQIRGWELPEIVPVPQIPPVQVHCVGAGVVDFNPIRELPVFIGHGARVRGHEFANNDVVLAETSEDSKAKNSSRNKSLHNKMQIGLDLADCGYDTKKCERYNTIPLL
jgi:hypothetical protein